MNRYKFTRLFSLLLALGALAGGWAVYALGQNEALRPTTTAVAPTSASLSSDLFLDEQFGLPGAVYHSAVGVDGAAVAANGRLYLSGAFVYAGGHNNRQRGSWDDAPIGYGLIWDGQSWQGLPGKLWYERDSTPGPREAAVLYDIAVNAGGQIAVTANRLDWVEQPDGALQPAKKIALWDGAAWQTLDGGLDWFCSGGNGNSCKTALADDGMLYAADTFPFTSGSGVSINRVGRWDGAQWQDMSAGLPVSFVQIQVEELSLAANGDLYLRGLFQTGWGMNDKVFLYRWNGSSWTAVLTPTNIPLPGGEGNVSAVTAILPTANALYFAASGNAWNAGGDYAAVYQRAANGTISLLTTPFLQNDLLSGEVAIRGLAQDGQGELIAGGFFYQNNPANVAIRSIGRWDGAAWQPLGAGVNADSKGWYNYVPAVSNLISLPDGVYAHGRFHQIGAVAAVNVARWDGEQWTAVCDQCGGLSSGANQAPIAYAFAWAGSELAVGGRFSGAGGQIARNVAVWDALNLQWRGLGDGLRLVNSWGQEDPDDVYALAYFQDALIAGGKFNLSGDAPLSRGLARWDAASQQWQSFGGGVGNGSPHFDPSYVRALLADDNLLYITGDFPLVDDQPMANFAIWDGLTQSWSRPAAADLVSVGEFSLFERIQKSQASGRVYFNPGMLSWDGAAFASAPLRLSTFWGESGSRYYYYSGDFTSLDGQPYSHIARYDAQTASWSDMDDGLPDPVRNVSFHTSGFEQFIQFVAGDMVYFWSHTNQMWRPDLTQPATNNMVYPVGTLAEAFLADGRVFFGFPHRPTAVPLFFSWHETDKTLTSHPAPPLPDGATSLAQAIAQAPTADSIVMTARYSDGERMVWQLWRYDLASQTWEALSSPATSSYGLNQPHALATFGGHVYFGGALEDAGDKVSLGFGRWLQASADLAVSQAASQPLLVIGQPFSYEISVTNLGPDTAVGVVLTNTLSSEVGFGGATSSQGSCAADGLLVTCQLGLILAGETAAISVSATPLTSQPFTNTVAVSAAVPDPDLSNNLSQLTLEIYSPPDPNITPTIPPTPTTTPTPTPTPTFTPLHPPAAIVFIPGIAGSVLKDGAGNEHWPSYPCHVGQKCHEPLTLNPNDPYYKSDIRAVDIFGQLGVGSGGQDLLYMFDVYEPILWRLRSEGFEQYTDPTCHQAMPANPQLFVFPYDWRLSNDLNAQRLSNYIKNCVNQVWPNRNVVVVAHSMGGLLARRYIMQNPQDHRIETLISVNTPWLGAAQILNVLETGDWLPIISEEVARQIAPSLIGAHQLLPNLAYHELGDAPWVAHELGWDRNRNGIDAEFYIPYTRYTDNLDKIYGIPGLTWPGSTANVFHNLPLNGLHQSDWRQDSTAINYYHIYTIQRHDQTIHSVRYMRMPFYGSWLELRLGAGDGTVPHFSLTRKNAGGDHNLNKPAATLWRPATIPYALIDYDQALYSHIGALRYNVVQNHLLSQIQSHFDPIQWPTAAHTVAWGPAQREELPPTAASSLSSQESDAAYYVTILGAKTAGVVGPEGQESDGVVDDTDQFLDQVIGMTRFSLGEQAQMLILSGHNSYTTTFQTLGDQVEINLRIGAGDSAERQIRYLDVPAVAGQSFQLRLNVGDVAATLFADLDGDGIFETEIDPTIDVSGDEANDMERPRISAQTSISPGFQFNVVFTAEDNGPGPVQIFVSDWDGGYQPYTQPLTVAGLQTPRLYAFAQDSAGNRSALLELNLVNFIYLPLVGQ